MYPSEILAKGHRQRKKILSAGQELRGGAPQQALLSSCSSLFLVSPCLRPISRRDDQFFFPKKHKQGSQKTKNKIGIAVPFKGHRHLIAISPEESVLRTFFLKKHKRTGVQGSFAGISTF
jgi:hypothetical protein